MELQNTWFTNYSLFVFTGQDELVQSIDSALRYMNPRLVIERFPGIVKWTDLHDTWHSHEMDLCKLSAVFPGTLFVLHGDGIMLDATPYPQYSLWLKYFKDGCIQRCPGKITYADYDPNLMRPLGKSECDTIMQVVTCTQAHANHGKPTLAKQPR